MIQQIVIRFGMSEEEYRQARQEAWQRYVQSVRSTYSRPLIKELKAVFDGEAKPYLAGPLGGFPPTEEERERAWGWQLSPHQNPEVWGNIIENSLLKAQCHGSSRTTALHQVLGLLASPKRECYAYRYGWRLEWEIDLFRYVLGDTYQSTYMFHGESVSHPIPAALFISEWTSAVLAGLSSYIPADDAVMYLIGYCESVLPHIPADLFDGNYSRDREIAAVQHTLYSAFTFLSSWRKELPASMNNAGLSSEMIDMVLPGRLAFEERFRAWVEGPTIPEWYKKIYREQSRKGYPKNDWRKQPPERYWAPERENPALYRPALGLPVK